MSDYKSFDQLQTNELSVLRHGFFRPWFELSDGQFCYGKLSTIGSWKPIVVLETAQGSWTVKHKGFMSKTFFIQQPEEVTIGTVIPAMLSRKIDLSMNDGFTASFIVKAFLSRTSQWVNEQYGDILSIKPSLWSFKTPFTVTIDLNLLKKIPYLPLITLLGVNLILLKQSQAAAGAH
jgi:hypothetical protein